MKQNLNTEFMRVDRYSDPKVILLPLDRSSPPPPDSCGSYFTNHFNFHFLILWRRHSVPKFYCWMCMGLCTLAKENKFRATAWLLPSFWNNCMFFIFCLRFCVCLTFINSAQKAKESANWNYCTIAAKIRESLQFCHWRSGTSLTLVLLPSYI